MQPGDHALSAELLRDTAQRYRASGRFAFHYVRGKLRRDPVALELINLAAAPHFGTVADLGCGRGQFAACLLQAGLAQSVIGVDFRQQHLAQATAAMDGLAFSAYYQDYSIDQRVLEADTILLIDVLYQLPSEAQAELLLHAAQAARHRLIVRTANPAQGLRSKITRAVEILCRPFWPNSGREVNAQPINDVVAVMTACGLRTRIKPCWAGTPFSNVLIVGERF
jgi:2-polyprenyl-3-methyl-5-hydroxy-6-metoxy-1,4-benzoquinol methylase